MTAKKKQVKEPKFTVRRSDIPSHIDPDLGPLLGKAVKGAFIDGHSLVVIFDDTVVRFERGEMESGPCYMEVEIGKLNPTFDLAVVDHDDMIDTLTGLRFTGLDGDHVMFYPRAAIMRPNGVEVREHTEKQGKPN